MIWLLVSFAKLNAQTINTEFADKVVDSYYSRANLYFSDFYGGEGYNFPIPMNPKMIEGANTNYFVSLPTGSFIIMEFTNNKIIDYPNQDDIFVTENGCNNEKADVYISSDGLIYTRLGTVDDCYESSLDLGSIGYEDPVRFVKVVGLDFGGNSPGFDLINVRGLPNSSVEVTVDAIADSLDNLSKLGFISTNKSIPSGYEWTIESDQLKNAVLSLYDPDKNKLAIHYRLIEENKIVIDASGFKKGIYVLEIRVGNDTFTQKIILL